MKQIVTKKNNSKFKSLLAILVVILLAVFPLVFNKNAEFEGADDKASSAIEELAPNYKIWNAPMWSPPSGEVESLLFALQASIGTGFIAFYIGRGKGRKDALKDKSND
jgi:cobalt/nickel transport protein